MISATAADDVSETIQTMQIEQVDPLPDRLRAPTQKSGYLDGALSLIHQQDHESSLTDDPSARSGETVQHVEFVIRNR